MIYTLHYDYKPKDKAHQKFIKEIENILDKQPEVLYQFFPGYNFICDHGRLELLLPPQDVLLIHPGTRGQTIVTREFPFLFPHLQIGLLTHCQEHYTDETGLVTTLDYQKPKEIADFVLSRKVHLPK